MAVRNISVVISANTSQYVAGLNRAASATKQFHATVAGSTKSTTNAAQANNQLSNSMTGVGHGARSGLNHVQRLNGAIGVGQKFMRAFSGDASLVTKGLGAMKSIASQAVGALVGFAAIYGVISGVGKLFGFAKESIVEFDSAMTESLAIIPRASEATKSALQAQAITVANLTKFNPAEVAKGYYYLLSAGLDTGEAISTIGDAANFAQAGVMDLEKATEMALDVQTALGLRFEDQEENAEAFRRVTDVITQAAIDSNATIEQVGDALTNKFATGLKLAGRSLEEGAAIIETYASVGVKGKVAGQQAYMFLRDIQRAAIENAGAMDKYGISVYDANGNLNNLVTLQKQLSDGFGDMSAKQQRISLKELGLPDRSVAAVLPLIAASSEKTEEFYLNNQKASGKAAEVAKKQMESIANQMAHLRNVAAGFFAMLGQNAFQGFMSSVERLGEPISDIARDLAEFATQVALPALKPAATILGGAFLGSLQAIAISLSIVTGFLKPLAPLIGPLITLFTVLKAGQLVTRGVGGAFSFAKNEFESFKKSATGAGASMRTFAVDSQGVAKDVTKGQQSMFGGFKTGFAEANANGKKFFGSMRAGIAGIGAQAGGAKLGLGELAQGGIIAATSLYALYQTVQQVLNSASDLGKSFVEQINEKVDTKTIEGNEEAVKKYQKMSEAIRDQGKKNSKQQYANPLANMVNPLYNWIGGAEEDRIVKEQEQAERDAELRISNTRANYELLAMETGIGVKKVQEAAEAKGLDFTNRLGDKDSRKNREQLRDDLLGIASAALTTGTSIDEAAQMSEAGMDDMQQKADETQKAFAKAMGELISPTQIVADIKAVNDAIVSGFGGSFSSAFSEGNDKAKQAADKLAETQAEAYNKGIEGRVKSLQDAKDKVGDKYGKKKSEKEKDAIEAETKAIEDQIDVLQDGKKAKDDFSPTTEPKVGTSTFLADLKAQAAEADKFTKSLFTIQKRLAEAGVDSSVSDEIVKQLSALGPEGLPIIEDFANAGAESFKQMSTSMIDSIQKINPTLTPTYEEIKRRGDEARAAVTQIQNALVGLSGNAEFAKVGMTPDKLMNFASLGPEFQQILVQAFSDINAGKPAAEVANSIKSIMDMQDFGQGNIPEAIRAAMVIAQQNAVTGGQGIAAAIKQGLIDNLKPEEVQWILAQAGLGGAATVTGQVAGGKDQPVLGGGNVGAMGSGGSGQPKKKFSKEEKDRLPLVYDDPKKKKNRKKYFPKTAQGGQLKLGDYYVSVYEDKIHQAGVYADGGIEQHSAMIAKGGTRIWNEPETGGEAYIPMGSSKRGKSTPILAEVARQFGYGLMKFADGGFFGTAGSGMIGGGRYGTPQGQAAQTIVVPVQSKNETNFNGPIQGVSMEGALAYAERKKRQKNLTR